MAGEAGFEPAGLLHPTPFQDVAIGHSATHPLEEGQGFEPWGLLHPTAFDTAAISQTRPTLLEIWWEGEDSNLLAATPVRQLLSGADLQSADVTFPDFQSGGAQGNRTLALRPDKPASLANRDHCPEVVDRAGVEPATPRFSAPCSTC